MDNKKLENKAVKGRKKKVKKEKPLIYVATDKFPGLPKGYEKKISNKALAKRLIDKGYVKIKN